MEDENFEASTEIEDENPLKKKIKKRSKRSTRTKRVQKKKSKAPIVLVLMFLMLGGGAFVLLNEQKNSEPRPVTSVDEVKEEPEKDMVAKAVVPLPEKESVKVSEIVFYKAPELTPLEMNEIIKSIDEIKSPIKHQGTQHDLTQFASLRPKLAPQFRKSKTKLAVNEFSSLIKPFFDEFCVECHGPDKEKGGVRLDHMSNLFKNPGDVQHWQDVLDTLNGAQMPPKKSAQPSVEKMSEIIRSLTGSVSIARVHFASQKGLVTARRLNRREYQNSLRDLLGVKISIDAIPEDNLYNDFDTVGESLTISPFQVRQYFRTAEAAVRASLKLSETETASPKLYTFEVEDLLKGRLEKEMKKIKKNTDKAEKVQADIDSLALKDVIKKYKQADERGL